MPLSPVFTSTNHFQQAFAEGLHAMLRQHDGLGVYILALANAANDPELWQTLRDALTERHYHHAAVITTALRQGRPLNEPEDDLMVFLKLMAIGFENLSLAEMRKTGPWEVQFNPLRALRPPRASAAKVDGLRQPFNPNGFHFAKPFLAKEVFWQGELLGQDISLLYNKFPFAPLHGLLVPARSDGLPQFLTPHWHGYAWEATQALGARLPGFGLAYNSLGAYASVNHLHFQSFVRELPLPLLNPAWRHNGGSEGYPVDCLTFDDEFGSWQYLDELHRREIAYNLVYRPGRLYVLPRRHQSQAVATPSTLQTSLGANPGWYELAGGVAAFGRQDFAHIDARSIAEELGKLALS